METPKEKAKKLFSDFLPFVDGLSATVAFPNAKECALIAVEELIEILRHELGHDATAQGLIGYYEAVTKEIEAL